MIIENLTDSIQNKVIYSSSKSGQVGQLIWIYDSFFDSIMCLYA